MVAAATSISAAYDYVVRKLSGDPRVQAVFTRPRQDDPRVWIITEPLAHAEELAFYSLSTDVLAQFPDVMLIVHLVHAGRYENDPMDFVPPDADRQSFDRR